MADSIDGLQADLDKLRSARASGVRKTEYTDGSVEYRSDAELAAAISDIEGRLAALRANGPVRLTYLSSSKGL